MTTLEQAARQALKALEVATTPLAKDRQEVLEAIASLRHALEQPKQEPFEYWSAVEGWVKIDEVREHFDSVGCGTIYKTAGEGRVPLAIAQPKKEPVAWISKQSLAEVKDFDATVYGRGGFDDATPLYTEPPKREWVGLTDEERRSICDKFENDNGHIQAGMSYARAIEAKLKELNT